MGKIYLLFIVLLLAACGEQPKSVRLYGSLKDLKVQNVVLKYDGATSLISDMRNVNIPINEDGTFDITIPLEEPGYYRISRNQLYLTPGDEIKMDIRAKEEQSTFEGRGAEVNNYLRTRFYSKGGSYLDAGRYCAPDYAKTRSMMDSMMNGRWAALKKLKCSDLFRRTEDMRIKANYLNSLYYYFIYNRSVFPQGCTREEAKRIKHEFYMARKDTVDVYLAELAKDDACMELEVARYAVLNLARMEEFRTEITPRMQELNDAYDCVNELKNQITPELYNKLSARAEKWVNADFREAFMYKLEKVSKLMETRPAPDMLLSTLKGENVKLSDYKGKVIFVDLWATWCGPCIKESPYFEALSDKYPEVCFIAVSLDEKRKDWEKYITKRKHGNVIELLSNDPQLRSNWSVTGIPRFLLIDKEFKIIRSVAPRPSMNDEIVALLERYK